MLASINSFALAGLEGIPINVEVDIHHGLPHTTLVGLPDTAVREAKDRLFAALRNSGFEYPLARITVNLAPANVRKAGPYYDLPIALGILKASRQIAVDLSGVIAVGEVALDGRLLPNAGILPIAQAACSLGYETMLVAEANGAEAALVRGLKVIAAPDLSALVDHLQGKHFIPPVASPRLRKAPSRSVSDLKHVKGQAHARRALEIAAAGGHNILFSGPPGAGKTFLARCLPSILPPLGLDEALTVTALYSISGALPPETALVQERPFRSPHHTISNAGLIGGGSWPKPGEVSLAHQGVLFLDELPEFEPKILEALRQPLEDRHVTISRAAGAATFPSSFMLVAARNPCPCGYHGTPGNRCSCGMPAIRRYQRRISGPLMDRIDIHIDVPRVEHDQLLDRRPAEDSASVRHRVLESRELQSHRFENILSPEPAPSRISLSPPRCNAEIAMPNIRSFCELSPSASSLLQASLKQLDLSARAFTRCLKLSRTIADLEHSDLIEDRHIAEALQYRVREFHTLDREPRASARASSG